MKTKNLLLIAVAAAQSFAVSAQPLQPEVLHEFELGPRYPDCRLVQSSDGSFFGTTTQGGPHDAGTAFKLSGDGLLTTLVSFNGTNGASPPGRTRAGQRRQYLRHDLGWGH